MEYTIQLLLVTAILVVALAVAGTYYLSTIGHQQAEGTKVFFNVVDLSASISNGTLYLSSSFESTSSRTFCVDEIEVVDLSSGSSYTFTTTNSQTLSGLPVCMAPGKSYYVELVGLLSQSQTNAFNPGDKLEVMYYYTINGPGTVNSNQYLTDFTTLVQHA